MHRLLVSHPQQSAWVHAHCREATLGQHARCYASSEKAMAELRPAMGNVEFDTTIFRPARS